MTTIVYVMAVLMDSGVLARYGVYTIVFCKVYTALLVQWVCIRQPALKPGRRLAESIAIQVI